MLITLASALVPYPGVSVRSARALIRRGRLPAVKLGRTWLVSPDDVARLFAPVSLEPSPPAHQRESPTKRMDRMLRKAGFLVPDKP